MAAKKRGKCKRFGYRKEIQAMGPAKRVRYCKSFGSSGGGRANGRRGQWCVERGKRKVSCHRKKSTANAAARRLQKRCKSKVKVKRAA